LFYRKISSSLPIRVFLCLTLVLLTCFPIRAEYGTFADAYPGLKNSYVLFFNQLKDEIVTQGTPEEELPADFKPLYESIKQLYFGTDNNSGTVTDENGNPLANAYVRAEYGAGGGGVGTRTDENGSYIIRGLPTQRYRVGIGCTEGWYTHHYTAETPKPAKFGMIKRALVFKPVVITALR